jgi:hypothetical protein
MDYSGIQPVAEVQQSTRGSDDRPIPIQSRVTQAIFGAKGQLFVGILLFILTVIQTAYWELVTPPTVNAIFLVSMEALAFASYGIVATALGYRATERVEAHVIKANEVNID